MIRPSRGLPRDTATHRGEIAGRLGFVLCEGANQWGSIFAERSVATLWELLS